MGPRAKLRPVPATVRDPPAPGGVCAPAESDSRAGGPQEGGAVRAAPAAGNPNTDTNLGLVGKIPGAFARIGKETNIPTGTFYPRAASRPGRRGFGTFPAPGGLRESAEGGPARFREGAVRPLFAENGTVSRGARRILRDPRVAK